MNSKKSLPPGNTAEEIAALIRTLHDTSQRLDELTAGEVDTVADSGDQFSLLRVQEQLRHREAAILDALPAPIALLDSRGRILSVNETWRRFAGAGMAHAAGHEIGLDYLAICDSARGDGSFEAHRAANGIRSVLSGAVKSCSIEYSCHSPTGQLSFQLTVAPLAGDPPAGAILIHREMTAQKRAEESLRASELRFRQMAENIHEVFWLTDPGKNQILYVSPAYEEIWGRSCESLYASPRNWIDAIHPEDRERVLQAAETKQASGQYEEEFRIVRPDGSIRWIRDRAFPVFRGEREVYRIAGLAEDITQSRRRAEDLRESERRFSDLLQNVKLVSLMLDREARITYCNEYLLRLTGWQHEEVIGRNWFELFIPPEIEDPRESFAALLVNHPHAWHHENEILTRSGERRLIRWNNSVLRSGAGDVIGTASIGEDITAGKQTIEELRRSETLKGAILESSLDCIITIDHEGKVVEFNPAAEATFGVTREQALGKPMVEMIVPPRLRAAHNRAFARYLDTGVGPILGKRIELEAIRADGTEFPIELAITAIGGTSKPMFTGFIRDITARKEADEKIKRLNRVYAVMSGINTLIVHVRDRDELFREACRIAVDAGGFRMAWIGIVDRTTMKIAPVASAGADAGFFEQIRERFSLSDGTRQRRGPPTMAVQKSEAIIVNDVEADSRILHKKAHADRGVRSLVSLPLVIENEPVAVFCLHAAEAGYFDEAEMRLLRELASDIAFAIDHIDKREQLDYLAYYDSLTGLANQSLFLERLQEKLLAARSDQREKAVFVLDVERFRTINDAFGRQAGDELLKKIAERLVKAGGGDASRFARIGADRFAIVVRGIDNVEQLGRHNEQKMDAAFRAPFQIGGEDLRISAKVGIALFPDDGGDADTLLRNAEAALKKAKGTGERYVFFAQAMTERIAERLSLENQLRQALENEEFVLHYQPKVNLASGQITGAEALIRWNDPRTGLVPPGRFIPVLEETGLIYEVGRWALRKAIEDYLRWRTAGLAAVRIAVNVSPLQLRNRGFIAEIEHAISIDPRAAGGLELELTESLIMENIKHSIASLEAIRALGVNIAVDDFGTGFSSLSYLAKLPVDTLKIDRSFVVDMTVGPQGLALVSTIIALARSLTLKVVAEGV